MEKKQIKVMAPEGFHFTGEVTNTEECNTIALTFEEDKPKQITWDEIHKAISLNRSFASSAERLATEPYYHTDAFSEGLRMMHNYMVAYSKLIIIAKYFNGDWKPELDNRNIVKSICYVIIKRDGAFLEGSWHNNNLRAGLILFKDQQSCEEAIRIMGDELKYLFNY